MINFFKKTSETLYMYCEEGIKNAGRYFKHCQVSKVSVDISETVQKQQNLAIRS